MNNSSEGTYKHRGIAGFVQTMCQQGPLAAGALDGKNDTFGVDFFEPCPSICQSVSVKPL